MLGGESKLAPAPGFIEGCVKDQPNISPEWERIQRLIEGVKVKEVKNVPKDNGILTEIFRADWLLDEGEVNQVFQAMLAPGAVSAWHMHHSTLDRLFASYGLLKVVLFDARPDSPTHNLINEFRIGLARPTLIVVPPHVWHGVQNISQEPGCLLNLVNRAYSYEDPDHWRLPPNTPKIPYSFTETAKL